MFYDYYYNTNITLYKYMYRVTSWWVSYSAHTHTSIQQDTVFHSPKCRSQRYKETSLHQVPLYSYISQTSMHAKSNKHRLVYLKILRNSLLIVVWFQDTQLLRIPPPKERCSLVQRRKEREASLRDGKHLYCLVINHKFIEFLIHR